MSVDAMNMPMGWIHNPAEVGRIASSLPHPVFAYAARSLKGSGQGKQTLLYKAWRDVIGDYFPYPRQAIGCCVSRGFSEGVDLLQCVQIAIGKKNERFTPTSHEFIYGTCRVDIGGQKGSYEDGAVGAWAAKSVSTIGTVSQEAVGFPYDDRKCKEWGAKGVPAELKRLATDHLVKTVSMVQTYEELEDAIANGYPVPVCSDRGFTMTRDSNGFCRPSGSWAHCMLWAGTRTDIPGALCVQSWGMDCPDGPLVLDQPRNSFWVDRDTVSRMLAMQDSWSLSNFDGYQGQELPANWTYAGFF